jgi:D-alanyl-D-alanine dipeptidase
MQKNYIETLEELEKVPLSERSKYYYKRTLIAQVEDFEKNDEELVVLEDSTGLPFLVKPFWDDEPVQVEDKELQRMLDIEGEEFRKYMEKYPDFKMMIRKSVYEKLLEAQSLFPKNIRIVLKAAFRPIEVQQNLFDFIYQMLRDKNPSQSDEEVYKLTSEYVTDPKAFIPPHTTGAAVDIDLLDTTTNEYLDMGSQINLPDDKSWTYNFEGLSDLQVKNRLLITETMLRAGFANLASEWWHYSYGDPRWAIFYGKKAALYKVSK